MYEGKPTCIRLLLLLTILFAAACSGAEETPVEEAEEEAGLEEVAPEMSKAEKAQTKARNTEKGAVSLNVFEGEHENLEPDDTAAWSDGLSMTVSDVHVAPNERRQEAITKAEERKAGAEEAKARFKDTSSAPDPDKSKASPAADDPGELIAFHWRVENNGAEPVNFGGDLPCEALDENGLVSPPGRGGSRPEQQERQAKGPTNPLEQPLEPGQEREVWRSVAPPTEGTTIEIVCVQPPRSGHQGGKPNVALAEEALKASWLINVPDLERRGV